MFMSTIYQLLYLQNNLAVNFEFMHVNQLLQYPASICDYSVIITFYNKCNNKLYRAFVNEPA